MITIQTVLFFAGLLCLAFLIEKFTRKSRIPPAILFILLGFIASEIATKKYFLDTGIRWHNFQFILLHIFLPIVIFQATLKLKLRTILRDVLPLIFLALPLMLVSVIITACVLYYGINYPSVFSWQTALLAGALLSATDPSAVIPVLERMGISKRLISLLESESLFNDATSVLLFMLLVSMSFDSFGENELWTGMLAFGKVFVGGILIGLIVVAMVFVLTKLSRNSHLRTFISVIAAYAAYIIAADVLNFSGVIAVLTTGLLMSEFVFSETTKPDDETMMNFWTKLDAVVDKLIYLLAGVTITIGMFKEQYVAMLLGIVAVLLARVVIVMFLLPIFCRLFRVKNFPVKQLFVLHWGAVRGTVTLALALSLPLSQESWFTVQSIAYGMVLFTLFTQLTTIQPLLKKLDALTETKQGK